MDLGQASLDEALADRLRGEPEDVAAFTREVVTGTAEHREEIDARLAALSPAWKLGRMASVDRNVLRMAAYELMFTPQTPTEVVIDEAVELAKTYSTAESGRFVNGILASLAREVRP